MRKYVRTFAYTNHTAVQNGLQSLNDVTAQVFLSILSTFLSTANGAINRVGLEFSLTATSQTLIRLLKYKNKALLPPPLSNAW